MMKGQENREKLFELSEKVRDLVRFNHIDECKKMVVEANGNNFQDSARATQSVWDIDGTYGRACWGNETFPGSMGAGSYI